jgi:hypothetical protein
VPRTRAAALGPGIEKACRDEGSARALNQARNLHEEQAESHRARLEDQWRAVRKAVEGMRCPTTG